MRHQIAFRQYNPNEPAKYGLLFKSLNAAGYPYLFRSVVYAGKPVGVPGKFYLQGTDKHVKSLVDETNKQVKLNGRNISPDRLYTGIPIVRWLPSNDITVVGTLQSSRRGIPNEIKQTSGRDAFSTELF